MSDHRKAVTVIAAGLMIGSAADASATIIRLAPGDDSNAAVLDVALDVRNETLWSGRLRVGGRTGAYYHQQLNQAHAPCDHQGGPEIGSAMSSQRLSIRVSRRGGSDNPHQFSVNVSWQRPVSACEGGGTTTVQFDRPVIIAPGQAQVLEGDAGLTVRLRRET